MAYVKCLHGTAEQARKEQGTTQGETSEGSYSSTPNRRDFPVKKSSQCNPFKGMLTKLQHKTIRPAEIEDSRRLSQLLMRPKDAKESDFTAGVTSGRLIVAFKDT